MIHKKGDIVLNGYTKYRILQIEGEYITRAQNLTNLRIVNGYYPADIFKKIIEEPKKTHKEEICDKIRYLENRFKKQQSEKKLLW